MTRRDPLEFARTNPFNVRVGQRWRSREDLHRGIEPAPFTVEVIEKGGYAQVASRINGRDIRRRIRLDRFDQTRKGYELIQDAPQVQTPAA